VTFAEHASSSSGRAQLGRPDDSTASRYPRPAAPIRSGDREIGRVTSSTASPAVKRPIALAYVHRDFLEPGTSVTVGDQSATVTALPFVAR